MYKTLRRSEHMGDSRLTAENDPERERWLQNLEHRSSFNKHPSSASSSSAYTFASPTFQYRERVPGNLPPCCGFNAPSLTTKPPLPPPPLLWKLPFFPFSLLALMPILPSKPFSHPNFGEFLELHNQPLNRYTNTDHF